jgi:hypothetical protein
MKPTRVVFAFGLALATAVLITETAACVGGTDEGALGAAAQVITRRVPNGGLQPEAVVDASGTLHLLYFSGDPANGDLYYVRSSDMGETFSKPVRVNSQPGSAIATGTIRGGQLAIGRGGRVHVGWNGSDAAVPRAPVNPQMKRASAPYLYSRSNAAGTRFEPQRNINDRIYTLDGGGSIAADDAGNVYAAWHGNAVGEPGGEDHRKVWITRSQDDGATFSPVAPAWNNPTGACGCCQVRLLATPSSGLALLYRSATNMSARDVYLLVSQDHGRTFAGSRVQPWTLNACPMTSMSLAASGSRVEAAWETAGQVYFGDVFAEAARIPAFQPAPGKAGARKYPALAISPEGETLLVWAEGAAWARGGSIAWQVYGKDGRPSGAAGVAPSLPAWSFAAAVARPDGGFVVLY